MSTYLSTQVLGEPSRVSLIAPASVPASRSVFRDFVSCRSSWAVYPPNSIKGEARSAQISLSSLLLPLVPPHSSLPPHSVIIDSIDQVGDRLKKSARSAQRRPTARAHGHSCFLPTPCHTSCFCTFTSLILLLFFPSIRSHPTSKAEPQSGGVRLVHEERPRHLPHCSAHVFLVSLSLPGRRRRPRPLILQTFVLLHGRDGRSGTGEQRQAARIEANQSLFLEISRRTACLERLRAVESSSSRERP